MQNGDHRFRPYKERLAFLKTQIVINPEFLVRGENGQLQHLLVMPLQVSSPVLLPPDMAAFVVQSLIARDVTDFSSIRSRTVA
jgi:hypothetical protein